MTALWSDEDSARMDAEIRRARRESRPSGRASRQVEAAGASTIDYGGVPRGIATDEELARRAATDKALRRRARLERDASRPRQLANGRWEARRHINKKRYVRRFDTEAEAQEWLDQLREGN